MKRIAAVLILGFSIGTHAQNNSVEKSIFSIQTGVVGVWFNNESKLSNSIALRSEIGIEHDFTVGDHYDNAGFIFQPVLTVEPRYYYNLEKRNGNGKVTTNNSGNYFSIKTSYHPDWFVLNLADNYTKTDDLAIIPTWGLKRQIGTHFTYETAIGLGYRMVYLKENQQSGTVQNVDGAYNRNQYTPHLHLRIGYAL
ncbi:hypothetical protein SAMN05443667_104204 [Flavobacterium gillisiae]|uniref:Outer membrane protein beta-barrel domain-containing protein n=1 Tax=Flavobacterium gillisiae TaxID=150146 RepID=A0A1H4B6D4_9FLAO|nr:hypothetical protein [Flavobacterium gillisiae]SEA43594.1 hypothetical protein SAMN05443667_104204 [Flavobacterium gillisiae]